MRGQGELKRRSRFFIGNCVNNRTASTEQLDFAKRFGSGSGHGPLFSCKKALPELPDSAFDAKGDYAMIALQASTSASLSAADSAWDAALVLT